MRQLVVLLAVIALWGWWHRAEAQWEPLYKGLHIRPDAVPRLQAELKCPYRLQDGQLWVPPRIGHVVRLNLAGKGLPAAADVIGRGTEAELLETLPFGNLDYSGHRDFEPVTLFYPVERGAEAARHLCQLYLGTQVRVLRSDGRDLFPPTRDRLNELEVNAQRMLDAILGPGRAGVQVSGRLRGAHSRQVEEGVRFGGEKRCQTTSVDPPVTVERLSVELWLPPDLGPMGKKLAGVVRSCVGSDESRGDILWVGYLKAPGPAR